jgi:cytochrome c5
MIVGAFLLFAAAAAANANAADMPPGSGEAAYRQYCSYCHDDGTLGAPKIGDKAAWAPRIKRGNDAIMESSWKGKGHMSPRRWRDDLSADQFLRALVYLLDASR